MLANVSSCAIVGLDGVLVAVEVDIAEGLLAFTVVGLGDTAVQESRERNPLVRPQQRLLVPHEAPDC